MRWYDRNTSKKEGGWPAGIAGVVVRYGSSIRKNKVRKREPGKGKI